MDSYIHERIREIKLNNVSIESIGCINESVIALNHEFVVRTEIYGKITDVIKDNFVKVALQMFTETRCLCDTYVIRNVVDDDIINVIDDELGLNAEHYFICDDNGDVTVPFIVAEMPDGDGIKVFHHPMYNTVFTVIYEKAINYKSLFNKTVDKVLAGEGEYHLIYK